MLLASSGIAVQTQEDAMMASLKGIIDMSKSVSSSMEKAVDTFTGVQVEELLIQFTPFYFKTPIYGTPPTPLAWDFLLLEKAVDTFTGLVEL